MWGEVIGSGDSWLLTGLATKLALGVSSTVCPDYMLANRFPHVDWTSYVTSAQSWNNSSNRGLLHRSQFDEIWYSRN